MLKLRIPKSCIFFIILFCSVAAAGWGQTYTWVGGPTGDWSDWSNWDQGSVPGYNDNVLIPAGSGDINIYTSPINVGSFTQDGGNIIAVGNLIINIRNAGNTFTQNDGSITSNGNIIIYFAPFGCRD